MLCSDVHYTILQTASAPGRSLYSKCEDCGMNDYCPFKDKVHKWNMFKLSKTHGNAYLILCQRFSLPSDVIKIIEDNHESNNIRLDDAIHHICHKNPNLTREQVIEILKLKQPVVVTPAYLSERKENISIECYYVYNIQALYLSVF